MKQLGIIDELDENIYSKSEKRNTCRTPVRYIINLKYGCCLVIESKSIDFLIEIVWNHHSTIQV